jgi:hypothetical protein
MLITKRVVRELTARGWRSLYPPVKHQAAEPQYRFYMPHVQERKLAPARCVHQVDYLRGPEELQAYMEATPDLAELLQVNIIII